MYGSTLSLTSALDKVRGWTPHPSLLTPGNETRYPLCKRLRSTQRRSGWVLKISLSPGFDTRTVQHLASRYTNWSIPTHKSYLYSNKWSFLMYNFSETLVPTQRTARCHNSEDSDTVDSNRDLKHNNVKCVLFSWRWVITKWRTRST
jgi:hypothetical protein